MCWEQTSEWIKKKKCSSIITLVLFASKESKQDYVSLILFRIIPLTYASHLIKQHLLHSYMHPLQWSRHAGRKIIPGWEVSKLKCWKGRLSLRVQSPWWHRPWHSWSLDLNETLFCHPALLLWYQNKITTSITCRRSHLPESFTTTLTKLFKKKKPTPIRKPLLSHYCRILKLRWNPDKKTQVSCTCCLQKYQLPLSHHYLAEWMDPESLQGLDLLLTQFPNWYLF